MRLYEMETKIVQPGAAGNSRPGGRLTTHGNSNIIIP